MDFRILDERPASSLRIIKAAHTVAWAFFASCILLIIPFAWSGNFAVATALIGVVLVEVAVLLFNGLRCPLTAVAARYTTNRQENFDIFLPLWLARYNKQIFGSLFVLAVVFTLCRWAGWL